MHPFKIKRTTRAATAVLTASGALAFGAVALSATSAHADPTTYAVAKPLVGVGSNTIQDLFDALTGAAPTPNNIQAQPTVYYTPLHDPSSFRQVSSFDAVDPSNLAEGGPIIVKAGGDAFARPNGSGDGQKALSDAIDGVNWSKATGGAPAAPVSGQIDFFRSSSAPSGVAGTGLTWIDFAHDALSAAFIGNANVTSAQKTAVQQDVTTAELTTAYSTSETSSSVVTVDGVVLLPASLQGGSGTEKTFLADIGDSQGQATSSSPTSAQNLEENGANSFATAAPGAIATFLSDKGLPSSTPVIAVEPFSVGSWISQANEVGLDRSASGRAAGVDLLNIDGIATGAKPYTGTDSTTEAPDAGYYAGHYGRDLYVGLPYKVLNGSIGQYVTAERNIFGYYGSGAPGSTTGINNSNTASGQLEGSAVQGQLGKFGFTPSALFPVGTEFNTVTTDGTGA